MWNHTHEMASGGGSDVSLFSPTFSPPPLFYIVHPFLVSAPPPPDFLTRGSVLWDSAFRTRSAMTRRGMDVLPRGRPDLPTW